MAFGVYILTRHQRYILAIVLVLLNVIEVLIGFYICGTSLFIYYAVAPNMYADRTEVVFVFSVTGIFGFNIISHYLLGLNVIYRIYNKSNKKTTKKLLCWWTFAGLSTIINIFIVTALSVKISRHITRSMRHSLEKGVRNYLKDTNWKMTMDSLQFELQCCGVDSYKDWYNTEWLTKYHVNKNKEIFNELRLSDEKLYLPVVPWSCCKLDFPMQCFHDPMQQVDSLQIWEDQPNTILDSINEPGCLSRIRRPIENGLIGYVLASVVLFLVNLVIVIILRILYSSCRNAILVSEIWGPAPGWIFGRGDFGYKGGKSAWEYLTDYYECKNFKMKNSEQANYNSESRPSLSSFNSTKPSQDYSTNANAKKARKRSTLMQNENSPRSDKKKNGDGKNASDREPISSDDERALLLK